MSRSRAALPAQAEVVVAGAGIVGLWTALFLAREGRDVLVLERGAPWSDASGSNAGTLSLQVKIDGVWELGALALELWAQLDRELDGALGFTRCGGLRIALDEGERARLMASVEVQRRHGLDVDLLDAEALHARAPWLGHEVLAAGYCAADAYASPLTAGPALLDAVRASGAVVLGDAQVSALAREGAGYRVGCGRGEVRCRDVVLASGAWSGELACLLGISLPVVADLNMLHVTEPGPARIDRVVTHVGGVLSLKQYANGSIVIGGGWQGDGSVASGRRGIDHANLHHNLALAARAVPALRDLRLLRSWSGYEALVPDALPIIGAVPGHAGLYIAACARGGYTLGPAQAWIIAAQIAGRDAGIDVAPFAPARLVA